MIKKGKLYGITCRIFNHQILLLDLWKYDNVTHNISFYFKYRYTIISFLVHHVPDKYEKINQI